MHLNRAELRSLAVNNSSAVKLWKRGWSICVRRRIKTADTLARKTVTSYEETLKGALDRREAEIAELKAVIEKLKAEIVVLKKETKA